MLVYYGDELFALAIDGRDVASVFGGIEGPGALLQMEMGAMRFGRPVGRGHGEAETRRCRDTRVQKMSRYVSGCASACERRREIVSQGPARSDASAAWHRKSCKGEVARVGARDGDFSRENKVMSRNTRHSRGLVTQIYVSGHRNGLRLGGNKDKNHNEV